MQGDWIKEYCVAITVCDDQGTIIEMNAKAQQSFAKYGGAKLLGKNLADCHNPASQEIIKEMIEHHRTNAYTIESNGSKKLIFQAPRIIDGKYQGIVELSLDLPAEMPHHKR